jgi:hypothetical protein
MGDGRGDLIGYDYLEHAALGFALELESWPVFLQWIKDNAVSPAGREWAAAAPDIGEVRMEWLLHSPDPRIRAIGETVARERAAE